MNSISKYLKLPYALVAFLLLITTSCETDDSVLNDPGNLKEYRDQVGKTFSFRVIGTDEGSVWGGADGIYTDDSILAKAAVHAGKVSIGEEAIVNVTILEGQSSYTGNKQNGIITSNWDSWDGSFKFE